MLTKQKNKTQLDEILEIVSFIKDNAAMKDDVERGFSAIHTELQDIRADLDQIKKELRQLDKRTKEDTDALGKDFMNLNQRVAALEEKLKRFELARN